ncbi:hypothetical protein [Sorangium sp. So ce131]|uniref:hypothetical protein n=1 Tax=Sorangium sp. So ce131 TaxID=3133282 RepID=UPI003F5F5CB6
MGIAVYTAAHYHEKAYRRREVAVPDPLAHVARRERVPSPHGEVEPRALLELLWLVEFRERWVLILVGEGEQVSEVARSLGMPVGTAFARPLSSSSARLLAAAVVQVEAQQRRLARAAGVGCCSGTPSPARTGCRRAPRAR